MRRKVQSIAELIDVVNKLRYQVGATGGGTVDTVITDGSANAVSSNAVFDALALKQDTLTIDATPTDGSINPVQSNGVFDALALKAPLASPTFTGTPLTTTAATNTNTTQIASTAFVIAQIAATPAASNYEETVIKARVLGSALKAASYSQELIDASSHALVDNQLKLIPVYVPIGGTYTGVTYYSGTVGNFTADQENRIGLYSYSASTFTLIASIDNDATGALWKNATTTYNVKPFTATVELTAGTVYFVGLLYNNSAQTTAPGVQGRPAAANLAYLSAGATTWLYPILATQNTLPASFAIGAVSGTSSRPWVGLY